MTVAPATFRVAEPERRFRAFVVDRAIAWSLFALAGLAAWWWFLREGRIGAGVALIAGVVLLVSLVFIALLGRLAVSPGRALFGLRVVNAETGNPIGLAAALVRTTILGIGSLPMFGLGLATLAWTAVEDRTGERRGWHDQMAKSVVVDVRPIAVHEELADERPRHVVNLTAMRLMPVQDAEVPVVPAPSSGRTGPTGHTGTHAKPQQSLQSVSSAPALTGTDTSGDDRTPPQQTMARPQPETRHTPPQTPPRVSGPTTQIRPASGSQAVAAHHASGPSSKWRLQFDSGETFLVEGLGLVGRKPAGRQGEAVRHVVPLRSADMSISKTHAQFHLATDGALVVMDRGSTNGSLLIRRGVTRELPAGRPTTLVDGDVVRFGDREMRIVRESS